MSGCIIFHSLYQCMIASAVPQSHCAWYYQSLIFVILVNGDCHTAILIPLITALSSTFHIWYFDYRYPHSSKVWFKSTLCFLRKTNISLSFNKWYPKRLLAFKKNVVKSTSSFQHLFCTEWLQEQHSLICEMGPTNRVLWNYTQHPASMALKCVCECLCFILIDAAYLLTGRVLR